MSKQYAAPMHTAEHILNATMVRLLGTERCFSAHINPKKSKCDYRFDRDLTDEESASIQDSVNRVLSADVPVTEEFIPRQEAAARFNLERLPDDAGETLRIVRIGDYDACPCIGEHVASTGQAGTFRLTSHSYEDGVLRLRFKLG